MKASSTTTVTNFESSPSSKNDYWVEVKDGNRQALALFSRHYSRHVYQDGRNPKRFVGPGERIVLLSTCGNALLVWKKFRSLDKQQGVSCSIFRNESEIRSSVLLAEAEGYAWEKWSAEDRLYTYINPKKIRSKNPGYCFKVQGWSFCGITKRRKLHILEKYKK